MKQDSKKIEHKISLLNEDEIIYKKYYEACLEDSFVSRSNETYKKDFGEANRKATNSKKAVDTFINKLTALERKQIEDNHILISELQVKCPTEITEDFYFEVGGQAPIVVSKHNRYTPAFMHKHFFFEMFYVLKGCCQQRVFGKEVICKKGDFCLLAPDTPHSLSVFDDDTIVINIIISRSSFDRFFFDVLRGDNAFSRFFNQSLLARNINPYLIVSTGSNEFIQDLVLNMYEEFEEKNPYYEVAMRGMFITLLSKLLQGYEKSIFESELALKDEQFIFEVFRFIEDNYKDVTLTKLAQHFNLCEAYISRKVKASCNKSFKNIVQDIVFIKARDMLETTNLSVVAISQMVGFNNVEHFHRLFKKIFGMTAGEYRSRYSRKDV